MNADNSESVKINSAIVERVRQSKKKSGISIGMFFEIAATEKLQTMEKISQKIKKQTKSKN
jgi:hypothetical protein